MTDLRRKQARAESEHYKPLFPGRKVRGLAYIFSKEHLAGLTVMEGGEHWFHTEEQMRFLDAWILQKEHRF